MKKRILFAVTILSALVLTCSCSMNRAKNEGYKLYRSSPIGVQIEYPDFWEVKDSKSERTVAFVTPSVGIADTYRDNVTVCAYDLEKNNDLAFDEYVRNYIEELPKTIVGYNLVSEGEYTVSDYDAYRIVYEGETDDGTLRIAHTFIKNKNVVFVYSFIAEPNDYDYFNQNSETMLTTFEAINK